MQTGIHETMITRHIDTSMARALVDKRRSSDYVQVTGYIPKDLAIRFKLACTAKDVDRTTGIEEALNLWLDLDADPDGRFKQDAQSISDKK